MLRHFTQTTLRSATATSYSNHSLRFSSSFTNRPGPPPLSRAEQREFEELQRRVNTPASAPLATKLQQPEEQAMHPDFRKAPTPQFEGEVNPETGEVGGPKREPLKHGEPAHGSQG